MPAATETPDGLRLFRAHGVGLSHRPGASQAQGECPFCGKEKFFVNAENGLWGCKTCAKQGNPVSFLWEYWDLCDGGESDFDGLAEERGLLDPDTLKTWGARQSVVTEDWLVPGYNLEGKPSQLYRYLPNGKGGMALMASPITGDHMAGHQLFGAHLYDPDKPDLILVEGGWDGPALWETLSHAKRNSDGKVSYTKDPAKSILATTNVLGTPGCNVFHESWLKLFAGKNVSLFFDNDHPRKNKDTGKPLPPASWEGMKRIALLLVSSPSPPASVKILRWNDDGDHDPDLPKGYDVRDVLCEADDYKGRVEALADLFDLVRPMPAEWTDNKSVEDFLKSSKQLQPKPCTEFKTVVKAFRKALMWAQGLEDALACMLATILSTEALGDQLWMRVVGMPSCGKTVLCEAVLTAYKHTKLVSTIKGFYSGMVLDKEGTKDLSLIAQLKNKCMVVKDADVLLQNPALKELMSQLRDIYDRKAASSFRNNAGRDYSGQNMSALICGTESMRLFDSSELGERFLDVVVVDDMPADVERRIAKTAVRRASQHVKYRSNGKAESQEGKEMILARQLTAGFINHLRANQEALLSGVAPIDDDTEDRLVRYAEFTAFMRTRPSKTQDETTQRELCIRLAVQMTRLANCLAVVLGKPEVDETVMRIVRKVSLDTSRGRTLEVMKYLGERGKRGAPTKAIAITVKEPDSKLRNHLEFIGRIGVCRPFTPKGASMPLWKMTDRLQELYDEIFPATGDEDDA